MHSENSTKDSDDQVKPWAQEEPANSVQSSKTHLPAPLKLAVSDSQSLFLTKMQKL